MFNNPTDTKLYANASTSGLRPEVELIMQSPTSTVTVRELATAFRAELVRLTSILIAGADHASQIADLEADGVLDRSFQMGSDLGFRKAEVRTALRLGAFIDQSAHLVRHEYGSANEIGYYTIECSGTGHDPLVLCHDRHFFAFEIDSARAYITAHNEIFHS